MAILRLSNSGQVRFSRIIALILSRAGPPAILIKCSGAAASALNGSTSASASSLAICCMRRRMKTACGAPAIRLSIGPSKPRGKFSTPSFRTYVLMLSKNPLSDWNTAWASCDRFAARRRNNRMMNRGIRCWFRYHVINASRCASRLAGSSGTANRGLEKSITGRTRSFRAFAKITRRSIPCSPVSAKTPAANLGQRFHGSNHIMQPRRVCRTRCG